VVVAVVAVADVAGCLEVALFAVGGDDCDCDCMAGGAFDPLKEEVEAVVGGLRAKRRAENLRARSWGAWSLSMAVVYRSIFGFRYYLANTFFCYLFYIFLKYKDKHLHKTAQWPCDIPELMVQRIPRTKNTIYKPYSID